MLSAEARDVDTSTPRSRRMMAYWPINPTARLLPRSPAHHDLTLIQQATAIGAFAVWVQIGSIRLAWALWKALRE